jgi:hypothetical protein
VELAWLAGLLEGEGSFLKGPPSAPNQPRIVIDMTDYDVVLKVSKLFRVTYICESKDKRNPLWKADYRTLVRGTNAIALMKKLRPFMGIRRREQIDAAIKSFIPRGPGDNSRRLTDRQVVAIRRHLSRGKSVASLSRAFHISHNTLCKIRDRKIWKASG